MKAIKVSNPSRLCLFGEHQDYLGLEVVAVAINLRFSAEVTPREDSIIKIKIRDEKLDTLNVENTEGLYQEYLTDISKPIVYDSQEDFMRSTINVMLKKGYELRGFDIKMDSQIPIGKGMCSSSTMVVAIVKALLEGIGHPDAKNPYVIAQIAFDAEVAEFGHPGGMMDQYASALGGLINLKFANGTEAFPIERSLPGAFILFDSLERKDTLNVLAASKIPTLEGLEILKPYGIRGIDHLAFGDADLSLLDKLDDFRKKKVLTNIDNYKILKKGIELLKREGDIDKELGGLQVQHTDVQNFVVLIDGESAHSAVVDRLCVALAHQQLVDGEVLHQRGTGADRLALEGYNVALTVLADLPLAHALHHFKLVLFFIVVRNIRNTQKQSFSVFGFRIVFLIARPTLVDRFYLDKVFVIWYVLHIVLPDKFLFIVLFIASFFDKKFITHSFWQNRSLPARRCISALSRFAAGQISPP